MPTIPTAKEQGTDIDFANHIGLFVSAKTPPAIVDALQKAVVASMDAPEMKCLLQNLMLEPMLGASEEQKANLLSDAQRFADVAKAIGIERQ